MCSPRRKIRGKVYQRGFWQTSSRRCTWCFCFFLVAVAPLCLNFHQYTSSQNLLLGEHKPRQAGTPRIQWDESVRDGVPTDRLTQSQRHSILRTTLRCHLTLPPPAGGTHMLHNQALYSHLTLPPVLRKQHWRTL